MPGDDRPVSVNDISELFEGLKKHQVETAQRYAPPPPKIDWKKVSAIAGLIALLIGAATTGGALLFVTQDQADLDHEEIEAEATKMYEKILELVEANKDLSKSNERDIAVLKERTAGGTRQ